MILNTLRPGFLNSLTVWLGFRDNLTLHLGFRDNFTLHLGFRDNFTLNLGFRDSSHTPSGLSRQFALHLGFRQNSSRDLHVNSYSSTMQVSSQALYMYRKVFTLTSGQTFFLSGRVLLKPLNFNFDTVDIHYTERL